jgi:hypothetical protein
MGTQGGLTAGRDPATMRWWTGSPGQLPLNAVCGVPSAPLPITYIPRTPRFRHNRGIVERSTGVEISCLTSWTLPRRWDRASALPATARNPASSSPGKDDGGVYASVMHTNTLHRKSFRRLQADSSTRDSGSVAGTMGLAACQEAGHNRKGSSMRRYIPHIPRKQYGPEIRLAHNFCPGPYGNPGQDRSFGDGGFRYWITDEPLESTNEHQCFCGWSCGSFGTTHYGTVAYIDENGTRKTPFHDQVIAAIEAAQS